jgi:CoA-transferase family III
MALFRMAENPRVGVEFPRPPPYLCQGHRNPMNTALSHIKILDLSRILAGPWATQALADLGAAGCRCRYRTVPEWKLPGSEVRYARQKRRFATDGRLHALPSKGLPFSGNDWVCPRSESPTFAPEKSSEEVTL